MKTKKILRNAGTVNLTLIVVGFIMMMCISPVSISTTLEIDLLGLVISHFLHQIGMVISLFGLINATLSLVAKD